MGCQGGRGGRKQEIHQSGYERVQKVFWTQGAKNLLHWSKIGLHWCKTGFGRCKRPLGDRCSLGPKDLLHPLVTTFGNFLFSTPSPRQLGLQRYGANRNSGREISSFGPEMCTPQFLRPGVPLRRESLRYGAHGHSGREISNSGPEMCTPLFLRPKSKPAGREKPIRVAPIRVVTKYPTSPRLDLNPIVT